MDIGILGSGTVGQTIGGKLAELGHRVVLGTRSPEDLEGTRGRAGSLKEWLERAGDGGRVGTFEEAASHGEVVVNATAGMAALDALELAGPANVRGKIVMDISNPLDFSRGLPPTLSVCNDDSLGERIQRAYPEARVVKTLNTTNAFVMVDPGQVGGGDHHVFVSGNDGEAKAAVAGWLKEWFGWREVIDLGDITTARGTEMMLPLWIRLMGALGTPMFNFKVVR
jgi:hypothetical protein